MTQAVQGPSPLADWGGLSPLQRAVLAGDLKRVSDLVECGEDVNRVVVSPDGRVGTALMSATTLRDGRSRLLMVSRLLRAGALPNRISGGPGNLLLRHLLERTPPNEDPYLEDTVRALMKAGAELDQSMVAEVSRHSMFGLEYEIRRRNAADHPVEEPGRAGCCLLPALVICVLTGVVLYLVSQYVKIEWPW